MERQGPRPHTWQKRTLAVFTYTCTAAGLREQLQSWPGNPPGAKVLLGTHLWGSFVNFPSAQGDWFRPLQMADWQGGSITALKTLKGAPLGRREGPAPGCGPENQPAYCGRVGPLGAG